MVLALVVIGWKGAGPTKSTAASAAGAGGVCAPARTGDLAIRIVSRGRRRSALLHVPGGLTGPAPLVLAFHGAGGTGAFMQRYSGLSQAAAPRGMVVAYPSADPDYRRWTLQGDPDDAPDDVEFIRDLMAEIRRRVCVDHSRVYATGVSNGAGFTALLACRLTGQVAAISPVAGAYRVGPCGAPTPVSVLEIHGTADDVAPYRGRARVQSVRSWLEGWARRDRCTGPPVGRYIAPRTPHFAWRCDQRTAVVEHIAITGGTHAWPGAAPPDPGPPSTIPAAEQIVRFFAGRRLASAPAPSR